MAANIKTIKSADLSQLASNLVKVNKVKTNVENKMLSYKDDMTSILKEMFFKEYQEGLGLVTNFKVISGDVESTGDVGGGDVEGEEVFDIIEDGHVVQVVMQVPTCTLEDPESMKAEIGDKAYAKLFKEVEEITAVNDVKAFMKKAAELPGIDKLFKLGKTGMSIKVSDVGDFKGVAGVVIEKKVVNNTSFLSKLNDLGLKSSPLLEDFLTSRLQPVVKLGNTTEEGTK